MGPSPQRDGRRIHRAVGSLVPAGIYGVLGKQNRGIDPDVGRRKPQFPAPTVTRADHASDLVGAAQHGVGPLQVAPDQGPPDEGGRDLLVVASRTASQADQSEAQDLEAHPGAHVAQERHVAQALVAEVEVLPDHHQLGSQAPDQHIGHELLGGLHGSHLVERHHQGQVHARGGQLFQLLLVVSQQEWC